MKNSNLRYAAYISGSGSNIKKVVESNSNLSKKIKLIFSDNSNKAIKEMCNKNDIIYVEYDPSSKILFSDYMLRTFEKYNIDYCFSFGTKLLKGDILIKYKNRIINFHPSLLPHFPGFNAIDKAIESNVKIIGNTTHFIDESIDGGPIILQSVVHVEKFFENGYESIIEEQIVLMEKIDMLLTTDRIHVENGKVKIENANYFITQIYPDV